MQSKLSKNERLAKLRSENSNVWAKRTCHPRIGEEGILLELLFCLGVPRGDREANRIMHAGDPYREYRSNAINDCLDWLKSYVSENGGPLKPIGVSSDNRKAGGDLSPVCSEHVASDLTSNPPAENDMSPADCRDTKGAGESTEISDRSPNVGEGQVGEQQTFLNLI
jgi:hypothetical protein